jgi:hypothetical protein
MLLVLLPALSHILLGVELHLPAGQMVGVDAVLYL